VQLLHDRGVLLRLLRLLLLLLLLVVVVGRQGMPAPGGR
jgi:hypothetical protein